MLTQVALQLQKTFPVKVTFRQLMGDRASLARLSELLDEQLPADAGGAAQVPGAAPASAHAGNPPVLSAPTLSTHAPTPHMPTPDACAAAPEGSPLAPSTPTSWTVPTAPSAGTDAVSQLIAQQKEQRSL